ncbi:MAG: LmbE family N-acetylglucosaminyl deacetylase [Verrucomicrobiales bacterium]|jgi:LmbE family N-acetylglucosaminyl deacetylase
MKILLTALTTVFLFSAAAEAQESEPLRIIAFGAHPDDPEFQIGGCAAKWTALGHKVKLVAVTNGDIGHWEMSGGELAKRRTAEVQEAAKRGGWEVEVLDIHDGELEPTLENRKKITRLIREWNADLVFSHRPWDYHPDHRYVGVLVQDSAFMVSVPNFVPDTKPLKKNAYFFFFPDGFTKPYAFEPDIVISIDDAFDKKVHAIDALESQVYEGGALGNADTGKQRFQNDPDRRIARLRASWETRNGRIADKYRDLLIKWYGEEKGKAVKTAEAFEVCEYGRRPSEEEFKRLFPFFDE